MVNILFLIAIALASAFSLGFLRDDQRRVAYSITLMTLAVMSWISASWVVAFAWGGVAPVEVLTAGGRPPFVINLRMGLSEAVALLVVSLTGLFSAIYLRVSMLRIGRRAMVVLIVFTMSLCGIILTRDLFNLFVFIELMVISAGGLILLSEDANALASGFKYLIISQLISIMLLIGIIFTYHATATLNIDDIAHLSSGMVHGGTLAFLLMFMALVVELKPFPANGWALDIYQSSHPSFSAIFSAASGVAAVVAIDKLLLIGGGEWREIATVIGIVTFITANLFALSQENDRRLLGYSSVGQMGLILAVVGLRDLLGENYLYIGGGILLAHALSKAGLFWISGLITGRKLSDWSVLRQEPLLLFAFISFIALLIGLPPFPGFYAKWDLIHLLAAEGEYTLIGLILFGALLEAGYLFRWFGYALKRRPEGEVMIKCSLVKRGVITTTLVGGWLLGYLWGEISLHGNLLHSLPLLFAFAFILLDWLPARVKNSVAIAGMVGFFILHFAEYNPLQLIFAVIILIGGPIIFLASFQQQGRRVGFYPASMLMYAGLVMLIHAEDSFNFFAAWESLTIGSYLLIARGKESEPHALSYILFSLGGAFLILAGFALAAQGESIFLLTALGDVAPPLAPWIFILLAIGFMTKTASIGLHIWLPGAHAEAETDVSPMVSGILLKAGLFGLMMLLLNMGKQSLYGVELTHVMLWIGALSALLGNMMAIYQEDAKRLLAYSSIGQMGYALFGLALMNHLGWLMALMFVINHYIYKSMLFLSLGGVAKQTGTKLMYKMGGLITLMPFSFIAVLIGIIAVSGVPPLSGFGGRWIFYNAIMSAEYRLPMVVIFLAGPIAFLYLFRLI
ncbi:MAG: NADH-quinone oxidoreductase subunit F, partial [Gammaproteobacteria bacterium]|nr:NADH-quinone oxidoreductase subunit F [Gammaproteobacteria bacterium]